MLQETTYERKKVGLLKKGFYFIRTTRAVWSRVQIVERSRNSVRVFYMGVESYRVQRGRRRFWKTRRVRCVRDLPIRAIIEAKAYIHE